MDFLSRSEPMVSPVSTATTHHDDSSSRSHTSTTRVVDNGQPMTIKAHPKIIGLHVGSRVFYCSRSTMANLKGSYYFANLFGMYRNLEDEDLSYMDPNGIRVFLLERDGDLFAHVLKYLTRGTLHLPPFQDNQALWRDLRDEAKFFSLDGLVNLLQVTHSVPVNSSVQGIFHWLGGSQQSAKNQCCMMEDSGEIEVGRFENGQLNPSSLSKSVLLQHPLKPVLQVPESLDSLLKLGNDELRQLVTPDHITCTLWNDAVISLRSIRIRPTHVTMRIHYDDLERDAAAGDNQNFNLEASKDGVYWDLLRLTPYKTTTKATSTSPQDEKVNFMVDLAVFVQPKNSIPKDIQSEHFIKAVDRLLRRTWEVQPPCKEFYMFFRFVGSKAGQYPDRRGGSLEMFGDVHQE